MLSSSRKRRKMSAAGSTGQHTMRHMRHTARPSDHAESAFPHSLDRARPFEDDVFHFIEADPMPRNLVRAIVFDDEPMDPH
jgi:hypothetical protein